MGSFKNGQLLEQVATTVTAAGTTALTNTSKQIQYFSGSSTQTVTLPPTTSMSVGQFFEIYAASGATLSIEYQDGTSFTPLPTVTGGNSLVVKLVSTSTTNGTWVIQNQAEAASLPSGSVVQYAGSSAPSGYLLCNGASYSTSLYPTLFAAIGYTYGGSGSNFSVPNTQGIFVVGAGSQTIGGIPYSATLGTSANDSMQGHEHGVTDSGHNHSQNSHSHSDAGHSHQEQYDNRYSLNRSGDGISYGMSTAGVDAGAGQTTGSGNANIQAATATNNAATTGITVSTPTTDGTHGTPRIASVTQPANIALNYIIKT